MQEDSRLEFHWEGNELTKFSCENIDPVHLLSALEYTIDLAMSRAKKEKNKNGISKKEEVEAYILNLISNTRSKGQDKKD